MSKFDPLEETQENLHPVVVAHRAREAVSLPEPAPQLGRSDGGVRMRFATVTALLLFTGALLLWLLLPVKA